MLRSKSRSKDAALRPTKRPSKRTQQLMIDEIMRRFAAASPDPRCELYYRTPFQLLLSVALSAQTTDKAVNAAMTASYDAGLTPESVVAMGEKSFLHLIRRIGLAPTKAKRAVALARILIAQHGSQVPQDRASLEALPGVGRKTASVVLGEIFREPTLAVDTHVFRVTERLGLHHTKTADACSDVLSAVIGPQYLPTAHHWLVLHGRYVCKARAPLCGSCVLNDLCPSATLSPQTAARKTAQSAALKALKGGDATVALPAAKAPRRARVTAASTPATVNR